MTDHYYVADPGSEDEVRDFETEIDGRKFTFSANSGVFSKSGLDYGTKLLIETVLKDHGETKRGSASEEKPSLCDLGCGYGPIGIILNRLIKTNMTVLYDVNNRAVGLARINIEKNAAKRTEARSLDVSSGEITEKFEICVTNPPIRAGKETVFSFYRKAYEILKDNGVFYCVIQKKQGADSTKKKLTEIFGNVEVVGRSAGYHVLKCIKQ
ncbi:MAG: methyltransferase [Clostridia bacterium]|jgi:16S rRNA (guanine1207-N2)-methyltransferase